MIHKSIFKNIYLVSITIFLIDVVVSCDNPNDIVAPPPDFGFVPTKTVEVIPFEDLLDLTQEHTFKYFWDFAEPVSGLAREDSSRPNIITIGV